MTDDAPVMDTAPVSEPINTEPQAEPNPVVQAEPQLAAFNVPEEYKDQPWVSKIKTPDDLWKQVDNLQQVAGRKYAVPDFDKASPEDVETFYNHLRPKEKSAYQIDNVPDDIKDKYADAFYKNGVSAHQANALLNDFRSMEESYVNELTDREKFAIGGFDNDKINSMTTYLESSLGKDTEEFNAVFSLPNDKLAAVYKLVDKVKSEYGAKETGAPAGGGEGQAVGSDLEKQASGLRKELQEIVKRPHTGQEKSELINKLHAINQELVKRQG